MHRCNDVQKLSPRFCFMQQSRLPVQAQKAGDVLAQMLEPQHISKHCYSTQACQHQPHVPHKTVVGNLSIGCQAHASWQGQEEEVEVEEEEEEGVCSTQAGWQGKEKEVAVPKHVGTESRSPELCRKVDCILAKAERASKAEREKCWHRALQISASLGLCI